MLIQPESRIVFIGDSVTHWYCNRTPPDNLGVGYVSMVARSLVALYPDHRLSCHNRGWSGNRVAHLRERWERDCLVLKPHWVSLLIGINDSFEPGATSPDVFAEHYAHLLTTATAGGAKLVLMTPFISPRTPRDEAAQRLVQQYIPIIAALATRFGGVLVRPDTVLGPNAPVRPPEYLLKDAIHPSLAGHGLLAQTWLRAVEATEL